MKECYKCKVTKPLDMFRLKKSRGIYKPATVCKECESLQKKEYYLKNKDKILEVNRERYSTPESKEKRKEYLIKYSKDKEKALKEKMRKYYKENTNILLKKVAEYKKTQNGKISLRASTNKRRSQKLEKDDGTVTKYTLDILLQLQNNKCFYCKKDLDFSIGRGVHLDHYIPLSKDGTHSITNVVWSCSTCNLQKGSVLPDTDIPKDHLDSLTLKLETGPKSPL